MLNELTKGETLILVVNAVLFAMVFALLLRRADRVEGPTEKPESEDDLDSPAIIADLEELGISEDDIEQALVESESWTK